MANKTTDAAEDPVNQERWEGEESTDLGADLEDLL